MQTAAPKTGTASSPNVSKTASELSMADSNSNNSIDVKKPRGGPITCHNLEESWLNAKYVESIVTVNEANSQNRIIL